MPTKTQLKTAQTEELERLQQRIAAELEDRRHDKGKQRESPDPKDRLFYSGHTGTYRWEYVSCGHSERCKRCKSGRKHGPYLYRYFYKDGKQRSEYVKLSEAHKH